MAEIGPNTRLRVSPFYQATIGEGVTAFSPYNRMLMPVSYGHPDAEYRRLKNAVCLWDVGVERQVQLQGPDAGRLAQLLSARDLSGCAVDQGKYVPMCDHRGVLLNDPIVLKLAADRWWLSIADNNMLMWARAIASERRLSVKIDEPDVSPLAVQGPLAENVIAAIFGDWIRDIKFFWFADAEVQGIPLKLARSGYSGQGGFELYLMDGSRGTDLWNIVREAGEPWAIGPGNPNPAERIESGMLSYGGDTDDMTNPFEVRLDKYVDLDLDDDVIGISALREIHANGPVRHQLGVLFDEQRPQPGHAIWYDVSRDGNRVGSMTNGIWSPDLQRFIGYVLVSRKVKVGDRVAVHKEGRHCAATVCELPFARE